MSRRTRLAARRHRPHGALGYRSKLSFKDVGYPVLIFAPYIVALGAVMQGRAYLGIAALSVFTMMLVGLMIYTYHHTHLLEPHAVRR